MQEEFMKEQAENKAHSQWMGKKERAIRPNINMLLKQTWTCLKN